MNILITGANGQLGRSLRRLGGVSPHNYLFTDVAELDITDAAAVLRTVEERRIDVIVNCAAYTDVERAEEDEPTAELLNHKAAGNLAAAAKATGATLFHVSTDYVFDGTAHTPYTEDGTPSPLGAYGRTKLAGERAVMASGCRYLIFRTAWLYSEYGNNFLKTMLRLTSERDTLQVVFDQIGTPTYAGDLALAIFSIIESERYAGNEACTTSPTRASARGTTSRRRSPRPRVTTHATSSPATRRNSRPRPHARPTRCWTKPKSRPPSRWTSPTGGRQ